MMDAIQSMPIAEVTQARSHCYLWCSNAILPDGLETLRRWGYTYKGNIVWHKVRRDGQSDGRGVGFYFRNVTELVLFGTRGPYLELFARGPAARPEWHAWGYEAHVDRDADRVHPMYRGGSVQKPALPASSIPGGGGRIRTCVRLPSDGFTDRCH